MESQMLQNAATEAPTTFQIQDPEYQVFSNSDIEILHSKDLEAITEPEVTEIKKGRKTPRKSTKPRKLRPKISNLKEKLQFSGAPIGKAYSSDAGYDLRVSKEYQCPKGEPVCLEFSTKVKIPNGYFGLLNARSSINARGNLRSGIIDAGYIGTIKGYFVADEDLIFEADSRVAQVVLIPIPNFETEQVEVLEATPRSSNGFGSSGVF